MYLSSSINTMATFLNAGRVTEKFSFFSDPRSNMISLENRNLCIYLHRSNDNSVSLFNYITILSKNEIHFIPSTSMHCINENVNERFGRSTKQNQVDTFLHHNAIKILAHFSFSFFVLEQKYRMPSFFALPINIDHIPSISSYSRQESSLIYIIIINFVRKIMTNSHINKYKQTLFVR